MYDELIFYANIASNAFIQWYDSSKINNSAALCINDELRVPIMVLILINEQEIVDRAKKYPKSSENI